VDVGRIVPVEGEFSSDRGFAREEQLCPASPVCEIGEADDDFFSDAEKLQKNFLRIFEGLESL